jgi:hypothetical protein
LSYNKHLHLLLFYSRISFLNKRSFIMRIFLTNFMRYALVAVFTCLTIFQPFNSQSAQAVVANPVSTTPLPTVQVNGIVWAQVTVGNTVYATGRFTQARPAGVPVGGTGTVARNNLLAYDITTGKLISGFNFSLGGSGTVEGRSISASPDGTKLFVGGKFSTVNGRAQANFVGINLTNNSLLTGFSGVNSKVSAVSATNDRVYIGGQFTAVGSQARTRLASFSTNGTLITGWAPSVTTTHPTFGANVTAMTVVPSTGNLIIGGHFNRISGQVFYSTGAVKLDSGVPVSGWASSSSSYPIRDQLPTSAPAGSGTGITSLSTDGSQVFLTSYGFYPGGDKRGLFEGRASISPVNGAIIWINDCHGDSYSAFPIGGVLFSAGHPHDCQPMGLWGETTAKRALAETTTKSNRVNVAPVNTAYPSLAGYNTSTQLNWYPYQNTSNVSGSNQASWSVTGNANYVSYGGEFTVAGSMAQQGLVRYRINFIDDSSKAIKYSGSWVGRATAQYPDNFNTLHYTSVNGASATLSFKGSAVTFYGEKNPHRGLIDISIDGGTPTRVNAYASSNLFEQALFTKSGLNPSTTHTITIKKVNATYMDLDGFYITP